MNIVGDKDKCYYCERAIFSNIGLKFAARRTKDHIIPKAKGGKGLLANKVWACTSCNNYKGDLSLEEFLQLSIKKFENNRANQLLYLHWYTISQNIPRLIEYRDKYTTELVEVKGIKRERAFGPMPKAIDIEKSNKIQETIRAKLAANRDIEERKKKLARIAKERLAEMKRDRPDVYKRMIEDGYFPDDGFDPNIKGNFEFDNKYEDKSYKRHGK